MKFYKVHAAKYKGARVLLMPEQFDEIGPDVFRHTNFEYIILSRKVKTIKNYAFSDLKQCRVYLPKTIEEIEPLAFADIDDGNEFYCVKGSVAYKACIENRLKINDNIEECISHAENIKKLEETKKKTVRKAETDIKSEENINNKNAEVEQLPQISQMPDEEAEEVIDESDISYLLGVPPECNKISEFNNKWEKDIHELSTKEILERYDRYDEYTDEYRYLCYMELINRRDLKKLIMDE